ncbi:MAG: hypothetical protein C1O27_002479 [Chloroflexi bacterium]|jgi:hypothetical protein|nr:MAG: hypothetical protein C1O27_002479 [Chloroflexota bacterium]
MPEPVFTINVASVKTVDGLRYRIKRPFYGSQIHLGEFATEAEALEFAHDFRGRLKTIRGQSAEPRRLSWRLTVPAQCSDD